MHELLATLMFAGYVAGNISTMCSDGDSKQTGDGKLHSGLPDDVDVLIELKDWLFALEGIEEMYDTLQSTHLVRQDMTPYAKSDSNPVEMVTVRSKRKQVWHQRGILWSHLQMHLVLPVESLRECIKCAPLETLLNGLISHLFSHS